MPRSSSSMSFLFLSDLHVGSTKAICTPEPILQEAEGSYKPNPFQVKLHSGWLKVFDMIEQPNKVRAMFLNGEISNGSNSKKPGFQNWSVDPFDHLYDANRLLEPYLKIAQDVFVIKGTDYHSSPDRTTVNYDELFARLIGATPYRGLFGDEPSLKNRLVKEDQIFKRDFKSRKKFKTITGWDQLTDSYFLGKFYGKKITVTHHIPYAKLFSYRATPLGKETMLFALEKDRWFGDGYESVLHARGHVHYCVEVSYPGEDGFTTPCWKTFDAHLTRQGIGGITVHYGIVEAIIESDGHVDIHKHTLHGSDYPKPETFDLTPITAKATKMTPLVKRTAKK
jgi:hypothetical protein